MKERSVRGQVALLLAGIFFALACRKEANRPTWDVDVVVPLIKTTLTIGDLVPDTLLSIDQQGNVSILYSNQLFALKLDTVLTAPDTSFSYIYPVPFNIPNVAPGTTFSNTNDVTRFALDQLELRDLRIRSGSLSMMISNSISGNILGHFALPGATLDGSPFVIDQTVLAGTQTAPTLINSTRALDGYHFDLRGPQFNDVNTLATQISYTTDPDGPSIGLLAGDSLKAVVNYQDIVPAYAKGYFGTRSIVIAPDSTIIDLFENINGLLDLDHVTARLNVRNGIGVDARADIHYLRSVNTRTGAVVDLDHSIITNPLNLDRALDLGNSFQEAHNNYTLINSNSNIDLFLENLPDRIAYSLDVIIDPLGDVSNGNDFLYYESTLSADLEVEIPLRVIATDLSLQKTTAVDLGGTAEHHAIQSGTLHVFATNGFPFSAALRLDIVNAQGHVLSALPPVGTIASASVNAAAIVQSSTESELSVAVSKEQVDMLYTGGQLRITATFNTASQTQHVQLLSDHKLFLQVTAEGNYIVNGNE